MIAYGLAKKLADKVVDALRDSCERIEIAGSLRRKKAQVKDLEIVAIPKLVKDLFDTPGASKLDGTLQILIDQKKMRAVKWGDKYKQMRLEASGMMLDLFLAKPDNFGLIYCLRTGPREFSKSVVTQRSKGGLLPNDLHCVDGYLWDSNKRLPTPEEEDVFNLLDMGVIEPEKRRS